MTGAAPEAPQHCGARSRNAKMAADLGELLVPYMPTIRVPRTGDRVFKSECAFSFDSPVSVPVAPFPTHTHTHGATRAACLGRESASQASWQLVLHELSGARESAVNERVSMVTVPASLRGEKTIKGCLRLRRKRWKGFPLCPLHTTPLLLEVHTQAS